MRLRTRLRKLIVWGFLFVLAVASGALSFAYTYLTDSDTLEALISAQAPKYLPGSRLEIGRVQLHLFGGGVDLKQLKLHQPDEGSFLTTLNVPWLQIRCDMRKLWKGEFEPSEVIVAHPILRLKQRRDGSWNLEHLLADPFPVTPRLRTTVRINKATVELVSDRGPITILHSADLTLEPTEHEGVLSFNGSALGDAFERLVLAGTIDTIQGAIEFTHGDLSGLTLSEALRNRLPVEWRTAWSRAGLDSGVLNVEVESFRHDPTDGVDDLRYALKLDLRDGAWSHPALPFPLSGVSASARLKDGQFTVARAEGNYGKTRVLINHAAIDLADPERGPLDLDLTVSELELNAELRERLPPEMRIVWDDFAPDDSSRLGLISLALRATRSERDQPLAFAVGVRLIDVAMRYRLFPFPLEHIHGDITWAGPEMTIEHLETVVGGQPLTARGTIHDPGPEAIVELDFTAGAVPIEVDGPFVRALPEDIRPLIEQFHPTGTVRGTAHLSRKPWPDHRDEEGDVRVDAELFLNEGCSLTWDGLPYPVQRLTGRLEIHPDHCVFTDMHGENGLARIRASGRAEVVGAGQFAAEVKLKADELRFDSQLLGALPPEWQATWRLLNPSGSAHVEAHVVAGFEDPKRPDRTWLRLNVSREDEARLKLEIPAAPGTPGLDPGATISLPAMQDIRGTFVFDNGLVTMSGVDFSFREAPVRFRAGQVRLFDTGRFDLQVQDLEVRKLRLDAELRQIMPPLMADFAARLDDGRSFAGKGNLAISWNGQTEAPAVCAWDQARIFFLDNSIAAGIPLEHIQGQIVNVHGHFDGQSLVTAGAVELDSFMIAGQQVTAFSSPLTVGEGHARLPSVSAKLLGGDLRGDLDITLDTTPEYRAHLRVEGADLARYAQSLPGRQDLSGLVSGQLELAGSGGDLRGLNGSGQARLTDGDLGKLPIVFRLLKPLDLVRDGSSGAGFDAADLAFTVKDGQVLLDPVKITGDALSLYGTGSMDTHGELNLEFVPLYGRDERLHVPGLSDATREASGQVFLVRVRGSITAPRITPIVLPGPYRRAEDFLGRLGSRFERRRESEERPKRR